MPAVCRTGDRVEGTCRLHRRERFFTGTWDSNGSNVDVNNLDIIKKGDPGTADCGHKFYAVGGSITVFSNGFSVQRVGDEVWIENDPSNGTGVSISGSPNTISG